MFNSLSVLAGLIDIDAKRAEDYVIRLSRIYRHILGHLENDVVSLDEAFQWLDDYMNLLKLRYANIELQVNPMELTIIVERKENMLVVSNNIIHATYKSEQTIPSYKLGLDNLAKRYLMKFGKEISVKHSSESFTVYLPIVNQG